MFIDIIFCFFTAYFDREENIIKDRKKIVFNYLKGWFIIDSISIFPFSYLIDNNLSKFNNFTRVGKLPKLYKLIRLAKLMRMLRMMKRKSMNKIIQFIVDRLKITGTIQKLLTFILWFVLVNHISACLWYFIAKLQDMNPSSWVIRFNYYDAGIYDLYIVSLYWTLMTVTTVGYGDVTAGTTAERIWSVLVMTCGVLIYSYAIGQLSSIVASFDAKYAEMNDKLAILSSIKREYGIDDNVFNKVRKIIKYESNKNQKEKLNFLSELPNKLRIELSQQMHDKMIQNLYLFKGRPRDFIAYVAPLLQSVKYMKNDTLYCIGDNIEESNNSLI